MKKYYVKMIVIILIICCFIKLDKKDNVEQIELKSVDVENDIAYRSTIPYNLYAEELAKEAAKKIVYEGLTLDQLGAKIDKQLSSTLKGYGKTIASLSLDAKVDPVVAASIILLETGCKWECSNMVKQCHNVGGMKGSGGCGGGYAKFSSLDEGLNAFVDNLSENYYKKGLNTPELMNKKYASSSKWAMKVNNYVKLIKAS